MQERVSSNCRRNGYTLIEILIVVSILAAVSAMAVPALRGPLERTRLRSAARNFQSAIGKARNAAIRTGRVHTIEYEPGSGRFRLDHAPEPTMPDFETSGTNSAIPDSVDELLDPAGVDESSAIRFELPIGVYFAQLQSQPDQFDADAFDTGSDSGRLVSAETAESDVIIDRAESPKWSTPITLYPNGRTEDITIRIATESSFIDVSIRGLTGAASFSRPRRWPTTSGDDVAEPSSGRVSSGQRSGRSTEVRP
jgi:prepilin-type N-terminal cleavage/methylation domain-containing protein